MTNHEHGDPAVSRAPVFGVRQVSDYQVATPAQDTTGFVAVG